MVIDSKIEDSRIPNYICIREIVKFFEAFYLFIPLLNSPTPNTLSLDQPPNLLTLVILTSFTVSLDFACISEVVFHKTRLLISLVT